MTSVRVLLAVAALAASPASADDLSPDTLVSEIGHDGARCVVRRLNASSPGAWDDVLSHIATGEKVWLDLAANLRPGTDAGTGEGLQIAVAMALLRNPSGVLRLLLAGFDMRAICSVPLIEPSKAELAAYRAHALTSLGTVTDPELSGAVRRCRDTMRAP